MTDPRSEPVVPTPEELEAGASQRPRPVDSGRGPRPESRIGKGFRYVARVLLGAGERRTEARLPVEAVEDLPALPVEAPPIPEGLKPVRIRKASTDRKAPSAPGPTQRATAGPDFVREKAEALGHVFDHWGDLGLETRTIGGQCERCRRWAMVSYDVPENYTEAQAVMRYKGDARELRCEDKR